MLHLFVTLVRLRVLSQSNADAEVIRLGERYAARWKGSARFYGRMAVAHWGLSHWHDCVQLGRRALAAKPGDADTVISMLAAFRSLDPRRGIAFGEHWLSRHGTRAEVCRHLSFLYDDLDRPGEALVVARRGLAVAPRDRRLAGCVANYLAKVEGAESALRFAATQGLTGDTYAENTLAHGLSSAGAHAESEKLFETLLRRQPWDAKTCVALLDARYHQRKYEELLVAVANWQRWQTMTAAIANEAGRACLGLGRFDEAIDWMKRAVALAPESSKFADNLAISLGNAGRYAEGIEAAQRRLESPGSDRLRLLKSIAVDLTFLKRHEEALQFYQQAFTEFPEDGEAVANVLIGLNWLERREEAVAFGRRLQEERGARLPGNFWSEYAWALHVLERYGEEEGVIRDWWRHRPQDPDVPRAMRRALNSQRRREDALAFVQAWVTAHPDVVLGWQYLAEQQETCGNADGEVTAMAEACRLAPDDAELAAERLATLRRVSRSREAFDLGRAWIAGHAGRANARLLNRTGLAADDLVLWSVAEDHYRQAHRLEPQNGVLASNVLRALICQDRAAEAVEFGRQWVAEHGWDDALGDHQAWALRAAGHREEESQILRRLIETSPGDQERDHKLLQSLVAQQRTDDAGDWVARCRCSGRATSRLLNDWGNYLRDIDRVADSEAAYREALVLSPDNDVAAGNLASLWIDHRRPEEAVLFCREWLARRASDTNVRRQLANASYQTRDYVTAESEYRSLFETDPGSDFLLGRRVACLRLLDREEEAVRVGEGWLATGKGTPFLFVELGLCAQHLQRREAALVHYEAALRLDGTSFTAAERRMLLLGELNRLPEAAAFGEQWAQEHPEAAGADFINELGILLDRAGQSEKAELRFLRASELNPDSPTLAGNAVEIVARRGGIEESIRLGQRFLTNGPPNAYLLRRLAEAYSLNHEHLPALDLLTSADALDPADEDVAMAVLRVAVTADELVRGVEFGRAWLTRPSNVRRAAVWARFARVCFRADFDDEAFAALGTAIEIEPEELDHVRSRFAFRDALRESTRSIEDYETLRAEWREDPGVMRFVSRAFHELGLGAEALEMAERNVRKNPGDEQACAWLAELHRRSGRPEVARDWLQQWSTIHGEHPAVLKVRARLALDAQDWVAALADAERVLEDDRSDEDAFVVCIRAQRGLGRHDEARARLHHWIEHHGSSGAIDRLMDEGGE